VELCEAAGPLKGVFAPFVEQKLRIGRVAYGTEQRENTGKTMRNSYKNKATEEITRKDARKSIRPPSRVFFEAGSRQSALLL
jgi:hypothetical protein